MSLKIKNVIYILTTVILTFLLFLMGYYVFNRLVRKVDFPSIFGYSVARTISGSMQPELNINDIFIIKKCDDYSVGDVVTYYNGGSYVTHRIVDISDVGAYITKGDFNDTQDELPVPKSHVKGKVIHSFGNGLWNLIQKTWTIQGLIIFILIVSIITFTPFIVHYVKNRNSKKGKHFSYNRNYGIFHASMFVVALTILAISFAMVTSVQNGRDTATVARFALGVDDDNVVSIDMENLKPGDQKEFDISIKNKKDDTTSQVAQDYNIFLKLYPKDNENILLPLEFSIAPATNSAAGVMVQAEDVNLDSTTHMGQTSTGKMPASDNVISHDYTITVNWPATENDHMYANQANKFEVSVRSKQLDEYDVGVQVLGGTNGSDYYSTLNEALTNIQSGQSIRLLNDIDGEDINYTRGIPVTLDLNGKTLTTTDTFTWDSNSTITIVENGGSIVYPDLDGYGGRLVHSNGQVSYYSSFVDTITAATSSGDTASVLADENITSALTYSPNTDTTIDLNGHTITFTSTARINVEGENSNVVFKDSSYSGTGTISSDFHCIDATDSTVTVESGTYSAETCCMVYGTARLIVDDGIFNAGIYHAICMVDGSSYLDIRGGTFTSASGNVLRLDGKEQIISGGTFTGGSILFYQNTNGNVEITGGTFNCNPILSGSGSTLTVKGGTFADSGVSSYVGSNYKVVKNANNYYDVVPK